MATVKMNDNFNLSWDLSDEEKKVLENTLANKYSQADNMALAEKVKQQSSQILTQLNDGKWRDGKTQTQLTSSIYEYKNNLLRLKSRGYDVTEALQGTDKLFDASATQSSVYSLFKTEKEFTEALKAQEEYDKNINYNTQAAQKDIQYYEGELNAIRTVEAEIRKIKGEEQSLNLAKAKGSKDAIAKLESNKERLATLNAALEKALGTYGSADELEGFISRKKKELTTAKKFQESQKEYEKSLNLDTKAAQKEIDGLEEILSQAESLYTQYSPPTDASKAYQRNGVLYNPAPRDETEQKDYLKSQGYSSIEELESEISQKKAELTKAKRFQEGVKLANDALNAVDFKKYSAKGAAIENPEYKDVVGLEIFGWRPFAADVGNVVTFSRENKENLKYNRDTPENIGAYRYALMTDDEVDIYNYYLGKGDTENASKYLASLDNTLNMRDANEIAGNYKGDNFSELLFAVGAGLDQFASGIKNIDNMIMGTEADAVSSMQYASSMIREDLDGGWGVAYDVVTNTANMMPSVLVGFIPGVGQALGSITLGASAAGNAYAEALNMGYSKGQARGYSLLVGGSEAGLQYLLGGISKLGGKLTGNFVTKLATKAVSLVDNAFAKIAISGGTKLVSSIVLEFGEEYLQEVLTPVFKNIALDTEEDINLLSADAFYAGFLGALTAGLLEGGGTVASEVGTYNLGKSVIEKGKIGELAKLGKTFSPDTVAYQIASKVNEKTDAYTLGQLLNEAGADSLTDSNRADIEKSLVRKGFKAQDAQTASKWLNKVVEGKRLNLKQRIALTYNDVLSTTFKDVVLNQDSTVNQRVQGYQDIVQSLEQSNSNSSVTPPTTQTDSTAQPVSAQNESVQPAPVQNGAVAPSSTPNVSGTAPVSNESVSGLTASDVANSQPTTHLQSNASSDTMTNERGEYYNDRDTGILAKRGVSAADRGGNGLRQQSRNTEQMERILGVSAQSNETRSPIAAGLCGWIQTNNRQAWQGLFGFLQSNVRNLSAQRINETDTVGRVLSPELRDVLANSAFKTEDGTILSLYHWTDADFDTFAYGDIGFHFGTLEAADNRRQGKATNGETGYFKEVYLAVENPAFINYDPVTWDVFTASYKLKETGVFTKEDISELEELEGFNRSQYDSEASVRFREILEAKGYDGIVYANEWEGDLSVIALRAEQIITVAENGVTKAGLDGAAFSNAQTDADNSTSSFDEPDLTDTSDVDTYDRLAQQMLDKPFIYTEQHKRVEQVAKKLGRNLYWDCKFGNGYIDANGDIHLAPDTKSPISKVFKHELTHFLQKNQQMYNRFANAVMDSQIFKDWVRSKGYNSNEAFANHIIETYQAAEQERQRTNPDAPEISIDEGKAYQEILADFVGEKLFGGKNKITERLLNALEEGPRQSFVDTIRRWVAKVKNALKGTKEGKTIADFEQEFIAAYKAAQKTFDSEGAKNTAQADGQYSLNENLNQQLQDWLAGGGKKHGTYNGVYFELGTTPDILTKHGAPSENIIMYSDVVVKITGGKHSVSLDEISKLPAQLNDPILLFKGSVPNSFVALTEIVDKNGNDVIVAIHINKHYGRTVVNKIASLYSKSDDFGNNKIVSYINNQILSGNLIDASNKKATNWFTSRGLQLPKEVQTILDANNIISNPDPNVNKNLSANADNSDAQYSITIDTEYMQAVEKGDEETAQRLVNEAAERAMSDSKARDMDGKLAIVYHGTEAEKEFYVFDKARQGQTDSSTFGKGYYFTADYDYAEMFSEENPNNKPRVFFLNITNPFKISDVSAPASEIANKLIDLGVSVGFDYRGLEAHEFANKFGNKRFSDTLQELGYDGVIVNDGFEYVVFDQNQMKSADTITYDNNGDVIPLEQRFDYDSNDVRYSIDVDSPLDKYTEEQYNGFGWVRYNDVASAEEYSALLSRYADYKHNKNQYPTTRFGEAVISSFDYPDLIMYIKGSIDCPEITKVVRINYFDCEEIRREILYNEQRQVSLPYKNVVNLYEQEILTTHKRRDYESFWEYLAGRERGSSQTSNNDSGEQRDGTRSLQQNKTADRADSINEPAFSNGKKDQYSLSIETATDLLEQYEKGKITKEEYLSRISRQKVNNPAQIAKLTPDDASTTPNLFEITDKGKQDGESRFYSNVKEKAKFVSDTVKNMVSDDSFIKHYATITNKETLEKAAKKLDEGGAALVQEWATKDERNMTAEDISIGLILIERYQVEGNHPAVINVMRKMRKAGTIAGQAVQSFSLLGRLDPTSMQMYMQKELDEAYETMVEGKTNKWVQANKSKYELTEEELDYIRRRALQAMYATDSRAKDIAIAEILAMVSNKIPPEKGMALKSLMRTTMLFNLKTQVRNVLGNVSMVPAHWASDLVGTAIDGITAKFTGYRTKGINIATRKNGEAFIRGAREAFEDYRLGIDTRQDLDRFDVGPGKAFNDRHEGIASIINPVSRTLNRIDRFNSFLLELGDRPFFEYWFTNSLENQMRLNGVTEPTVEMLEIAEQEALTRVWQDTNRFTKSVTTIKKILNSINVRGYGLGDVFIKFVKTPANLTKAMVDFSPIGLVHGLKDVSKLDRSLKTGVGNSKLLQSQMVKDLSNGIVGTLLYIAFYALASGLVKGVTVSGASDDDDDVAAFNREVLGRYPYTISIGDYSFSYDWMSPIGSMISTAKAVVDATESDKDIPTTIRHAMQASADVLFNQSFMQSLQEVFTNRDGYWAGIEQTIIDEPAVLIPQLVAQFASSLDEYQRETYQKDDAWQTMLNDTLYKLPWLRETLEPKLDALGRDVANPRGDFFNAFLNPANTYVSNNTETAEEVYRLYESTGEASVMYPKAPRSVTIDGETRTLTIKERNQYQKTLGTISDRNIDTLMHLGVYKEMTDAERAKTIADIYEYARAIAKSEYLGDESSLSTKYKKIKVLEDQGIISATEYLMLSETSDADGNNYLTNAELNRGLQTYIEDMRMRQFVKQLYRAKGSEIDSVVEKFNN